MVPYQTPIDAVAFPADVGEDTAAFLADGKPDTAAFATDGRLADPTTSSPPSTPTAVQSSSHTSAPSSPQQNKSSALPRSTARVFPLGTTHPPTSSWNSFLYLPATT